jgi:hypothetical protein
MFRGIWITLSVSEDTPSASQLVRSMRRGGGIF